MERIHICTNLQKEFCFIKSLAFLKQHQPIDLNIKTKNWWRHLCRLLLWGVVKTMVDHPW